MICNKCKQNKPTSRFNTRKNGTYRKICRDCVNKDVSKRKQFVIRETFDKALGKSDDKIFNRFTSFFKLTLKK